MPFQYYGGKKALARYYPPPRWPIIIEPFAGSAGYALWWAHKAGRVILVEKDPAIVALWRRLQAPDAAEDIAGIDCPPVGERCADLLVALVAGGSGGTYQQAIQGRSFQVTPRIAESWWNTRRSLIAAIPVIRGWQVIEGDYTDAPDLRATWFVDPPYWVPEGANGSRGDGYRMGASHLDFDALAEWCRERRGQIIVCEQDGAAWLPFRPLRWSRPTSQVRTDHRLEVVWTRGEQIDRRTAAQRQDAAKRRAARRLR